MILINFNPISLNATQKPGYDYLFALIVINSIAYHKIDVVFLVIVCALKGNRKINDSFFISHTLFHDDDDDDSHCNDPHTECMDVHESQMPSFYLQTVAFFCNS